MFEGLYKGMDCSAFNMLVTPSSMSLSLSIDIFAHLILLFTQGSSYFVVEPSSDSPWLWI